MCLHTYTHTHKLIYTITYNYFAQITVSKHLEVMKYVEGHVCIFERAVYTRILGLVYDYEKENWRILTNKEISGIV